MNPNSPKIRWLSEGEGHWTSVEGRFKISARYRHTVNPDSYTICDYMGGIAYLNGRSVYTFVERNYDTVMECKLWAHQRLVKQWEEMLK